MESNVIYLIGKLIPSIFYWLNIWINKLDFIYFSNILLKLLVHVYEGQESFVSEYFSS